MAQVSPFTRNMVASMRHLYPESLADKSFDNTGLLLEAPIPSHLPRKSNSVLLTIDLTSAVADEAIEENHSAVVAYHPIIFRGLKSITLDDPQQQSLLRLASHGVSVYSPHTAVDIVPGGMADWLCDIVSGKVDPEPESRTFTSEQEKERQAERQPSEPASETDVTTSEDEEPRTPSDSQSNAHGSADPFMNDPKTPQAKPKRPSAVQRTYSKPSYPSHIRGRNQKRDPSPQRTPSPIQSTPNTTFSPDVIPHTRSVITPSPSSAIEAANTATQMGTYTNENTGAGRLITFSSPQPLSALITRIAHATGICPGSGGSVIRGCKESPDLVFTGEMSHHEALAIIERGGCVVTLFHSNSERGYLDGVMRERLEEELSRRWDGARSEQKADEEGRMGKEILEDDTVSVVVSRWDRDPYGIVVLQESGVRGENVG
ncbi:hypothetical protein LTR24_004383 [Lithohypha guttulata]|uniref:NIF3-like protein 1 n=1 Tax=Lithohypha guttulata TaxID=1690604 RepID=A0ABR0KBZ4_9EURO|nr:hypothetical protein LTR24_004383 [Lithohypha guttulata]